MERVDIPASGYYKAADGKRFSDESSCALYESYCDKYWNDSRHREIEDAEGHLTNFFYIQTEVEALEISFLCRYKLGYQLSIPLNMFENGPAWFSAGSRSYDYEDSPAFLSLDLYIRDIKETIYNYNCELEECLKLYEYKR